jgi:[ribosomal protein S18]-alanine N-acetyltransferase
MDSFRQIFDDPKTFGTLAVRGRQGLVGYIIYSEVLDELHILNVAIDPPSQRHGIATMMLFHLHQNAIRRKLKMAYLEVRESNLSAQHLYEKFGYKPLGRRKDYYADTHEDAIVMMTELRK